MPAKTYLWIEDHKGKSGYTFWKIFMNYFCSDVIVESKNNNSELVKAVKNLNDNENRYIIVLDNSFDNFQVYQEQKRLKKYIDSKSNISTISIICFEYILLEFDKLTNWIYAPNDEFWAKRSDVIQAREKLVEILQSGELDYKSIQKIAEYDHNLGSHNIEQLSAKMLFDLTRNTGFEVSKGRIGDCWIKSCCEWSDREENDICGLDHSRLSVRDKMKEICHGTSLYTELSNLNLEALM